MICQFLHHRGGEDIRAFAGQVEAQQGNVGMWERKLNGGHGSFLSLMTFDLHDRGERREAGGEGRQFGGREMMRWFMMLLLTLLLVAPVAAQDLNKTPEKAVQLTIDYGDG